MRLLLFFFLFNLSWSLFSQKVLLIEKRNSAQTQKLYEGAYIQYKLIGEKKWRDGEIYDLRDDTQMIVFKNHYLPLDQIEMMREQKPWPRNIGYMLMTFGLSWSGIAAVGTATDGDPNTSYKLSDAAVTGASVATGLLLPMLFGTRKIRFGEKQKWRLRVVDVSF